MYMYSTILAYPPPNIHDSGVNATGKVCITIGQVLIVRF